MPDEPLSNESAAPEHALFRAIAVVERVRARAGSKPYSTLAAAAGVGYLLGGGLFSATTSRALRLAFRVATIPSVRGYLLALILAKRSPEGPPAEHPK